MGLIFFYFVGSAGVAFLGVWSSDFCFSHLADTHEALLWTSPCFVVALLAPLSLFLCWLAGAGRRSITRTKQL